jgi:hypothetical protein
MHGMGRGPILRPEPVEVKVTTGVNCILIEKNI